MLTLSSQLLGETLRDLSAFFLRPRSVYHRRYEALRAFYVDRKPAREVARQFGYTIHGFNSMRRDFAKRHRWADFFRRLDRHPWSIRQGRSARVRDRVVQMRKQFWSVYDIRDALGREGFELDVSAIHRILRREGFGKLPRRLEEERREPGPEKQKRGFRARGH